jgi:hypothetical protein
VDLLTRSTSALTTGLRPSRTRGWISRAGRHGLDRLGGRHHGQVLPLSDQQLSEHAFGHR